MKATDVADRDGPVTCPTGDRGLRRSCSRSSAGGSLLRQCRFEIDLTGYPTSHRL